MTVYEALELADSYGENGRSMTFGEGDERNDMAEALCVLAGSYRRLVAAAVRGLIEGAR